MVLKGSEALSFKLYRCQSKFGLFKNTSNSRLCYKLQIDFTADFTRRGGQGHIKPPGSKVYIDGLNTESSLASKFYLIRDEYYNIF